MEHVDNNMDDLFRKAGELYPLKTTESDWDGVLGKIKEEIPGERHTTATSGGRNRRWALLLLLIPAALGSAIYFSHSSKNNSSTVISRTNTVDERKGNNEAVIQSGKINGNSDQRDIVATTKENAVPATENAATVKDQHASLAVSNPGQSVAVVKAQTGNNITHLDANVEGMAAGAVYARKSRQPKPSGTPHAPESVEKYNPAIENTSAVASEFREPLAKPFSLSVAGSVEIISVNGKPLPSSTNTLNTTETAKAKKNKTNTQKGFYVTVLGGPNGSTVKQQSVDQTGYSVGVLIGYRFNQHFSLESGLMWDKMFYYSSGEYFNQSKLIIPSNEHIINVNGNCNMFEIPLNIRYDFASRSAHSNFYVKGGLSSYLMKKEYYSYNAEGPSYVPWAGDSTYYNATKNILSILQISAGYEYAIGKNTKIQIEPYVKLPLQGIGVGSMPISTFGINVGISYSFH